MKNRLICSFTLISLIISLFLPIVSFAKTDIPSKNPVSPALNIIANDTELVKTGLFSSAVEFAPEDFDELLGLKKVSAITVLSLPSVTDGKLMLGTLTVARNQTISRASIASLRFEPASSYNESEKDASFIFTAPELEYSVGCTMFILEKENYAPTVSFHNDGSLDFSTYKNITYFGALKAADPEGDALRYTISEKPQKGLLRLTDINFGSFTYTPSSDYTGRDSFCYYVSDRYGNRSETVTVNIDVKKCDDSMTFADLDGHYAHNAAIRLASYGVMNGFESKGTASGISASPVAGGALLFLPDEPVSRCEFVVCAMKAVGVKPLSGVIDTGFTDDADIPAEYKGYISAAAELGYVSGVKNDLGTALCPDYQITRAEVAVILNNILIVEQPALKTVFADSSSVPSWAAPSFDALCECGIFSGSAGGYISPFTPMTRAMSAEVLCAVIDYIG